MALRGIFGLRGLWGGGTPQTPVNSLAQINICGIGDGLHQIYLWERDTLELLHNGPLPFLYGTVILEVPSLPGTKFIGVWEGANPPITGSGIYGVTYE